MKDMTNQYRELRETMSKHFSKHFRGTVSDYVIIKADNSAIAFLAKNWTRDDRLEPLFNIYIERDLSSDANKCTDVKLSYYATSDNSDFELARLENLGKVAKELRLFKQNIIDKINTFEDTLQFVSKVLSK